jgi:rhodanese-related sulfurtransferase
MSFPTEISVSQLSRLVGLPGAPVLIDVRSERAYASETRLIPTALRHDSRDVSNWAKLYAGRSIVVICQDGQTFSPAAAAWLRHEGLEAQTLEGGFDAWRADRQPLLRADKIPPRDAEGRTIWVTRARPKVVRIACPWLIRRFIDPRAVFLFVAPSEVPAVADHLKATPFDVAGSVWNDRANTCTFDVMVEEFGLTTEPLLRLALIVRGADTGQLDLTQQSGGLLAASLGYSRMYRDDLAQLEASMALFDAFYRWCRDATQEKHG